MGLICENEEVLQKFVGENSFRNAEIEKYIIRKNDEGVVVDVQFRMRPKSDWPKVLIRFSCCEYYDLYCEGDYHFYCVSHLKLFISDVGVVSTLSLTPTMKKVLFLTTTMTLSIRDAFRPTR